jgi:hypothetical protein
MKKFLTDLDVCLILDAVKARTTFNHSCLPAGTIKLIGMRNKLS